MTETTHRWRLPLIYPNQAQKERTLNESLTTIDLLLQPVVQTIADSAPSDPAPGEAWIVGRNATGAWAEHADAIAVWTDGGWRFVAPHHGLAVWMQDAELTVRHDGSEWVIGRIDGAMVRIAGKQVVGPQQPAIAPIVGGATVDVEARAALAAIVDRLAHHGLIEGG